LSMDSVSFEFFKAAEIPDKGDNLSIIYSASASL
jgi:hypothetical protein